MPRRRTSPRTKARRNLRAAQRRAESKALREADPKPGPRPAYVYPDPPEGLSGEALENWKVEQRIARKLAELAAQDEDFYTGRTTHTPGAFR